MEPDDEALEGCCRGHICYINHNNKEQSHILVQTGKSLSTSLS